MLNKKTLMLLAVLAFGFSNLISAAEQARPKEATETINNASSESTEMATGTTAEEYEESCD